MMLCKHMKNQEKKKKVHVVMKTAKNKKKQQMNLWQPKKSYKYVAQAYQRHSRYIKTIFLCNRFKIFGKQNWNIWSPYTVVFLLTIQGSAFNFISWLCFGPFLHLSHATEACDEIFIHVFRQYRSARQTVVAP